jgi:4-amino-4-deoxychorismate lyase
MDAQTTSLVNGETIAHVSAQDRGFQYGDGVFETIAVYRGAPLLWEAHLERLSRGAERLGFAAPSSELLTSEASQLCRDAQRAVLKIVLTRGVGGRGYAAQGIAETTRVLSLSPWPDYPLRFSREGVSVFLCETSLSRQPRLAGIKHLNRLEQILARAEWRTEYAEGLMCDQDANVVEGTMSNVFLVRDGVLRTPELSLCGVEGIMRAIVLESAKRLNIRYEVGCVSIDKVRHAEELFLTNSLIGVWPIRQLQENDYVIGPITRKIQQAVQDAHCFDRT